MSEPIINSDAIARDLDAVIRERDALAATVQRVRALLTRWPHDAAGYPVATDSRAVIAAATLKLCEQELRQALDGEPVGTTLDEAALSAAREATPQVPSP